MTRQHRRHSAHGTHAQPVPARSGTGAVVVAVEHRESLSGGRTRV